MDLKEFTTLFSGSSSPDEGGFISTAGNKGSSLSTPGTVRSTPSSEALDVVADLRYESLRFRSLPLHKNELTYSKETNGNLLDGPSSVTTGPPLGPHHHPEPNMSVPLVGPKQYHPPVLNGNANTAQQNIEDLYAKVRQISFFKRVVDLHQSIFPGQFHSQE